MASGSASQSKPGRAGAVTRSAQAQARYEQRQSEVMDLAAAEFARRGYHGTTISDLVNATKLQRGGLYHYIGGKRELMIAIVKRYIDPLVADLNVVEAAGDPAPVALRKVARVMIGTLRQHTNEMTIIFQESRRFESEPGWEELADSRHRSSRPIARILLRGRQDGILEFDDVELAVDAFVSLVASTYHWRLPHDDLTVAAADELADRLADMFVYGIATSSRSERG